MCFSDILTHLRSLNHAHNVEIFIKKWFKIINNLYVNNRQITKFWNCYILAFHRWNFLIFGFSNPDEHRLWGINPLLSVAIRKGMLLLPARCVPVFELETWFFVWRDVFDQHEHVSTHFLNSALLRSKIALLSWVF